MVRHTSGLNIVEAKKKIVLQNGAKIAVIGGGPAGSFFAIRAFELAKQHGRDISIDIFEGKNFNCAGPAGCNHCGGIVAESLIEMLSAEGITLPSDVVRRGIKSYTLHLEQGSTEIEAPFNEQRIVSMFRGIGPKGCIPKNHKSFDDYLMELCVAQGARIVYEAVTEVERSNDGIKIKTGSNFEQLYDLTVGAFGLHQKSFQLFRQLCPDLIEPKTTRTFICEIPLDGKLIDQHLGNSMHVFLLNVPNIKFGALIPKSNYVTLVLLGANVDKNAVAEFLKSGPVKKCFPPDIELNSLIACQCYPNISINGAKSAYSDRVVLIGDSSTTKLYKNGIGAAYITANAAANTAFLHGISEKNFRKHFQPSCNRMERDNQVGKFIFKVIEVVQRSPVLKSAMLRMVIDEQKKLSHKRIASSMLWDTFTGSAPYRDIFLRFFNVKVLASFIWNSLLVLMNKDKNHPL